MTQPDGVFLPADWAGCERGNNLFTNDEQLVADGRVREPEDNEDDDWDEEE